MIFPMSSLMINMFQFLFLHILIFIFKIYIPTYLCILFYKYIFGTIYYIFNGILSKIYHTSCYKVSFLQIFQEKSRYLLINSYIFRHYYLQLKIIVQLIHIYFSHNLHNNIWPFSKHNVNFMILWLFAKINSRWTLYNNVAIISLHKSNSKRKSRLNINITINNHNMYYQYVYNIQLL